MHRRHEIAGHRVGHALDRRAAALRLGDHGDDARQHRVGADLVGAHHQRAGAVDGAADQLVAGLLGDRHRLAGDHGLVDGARALQHFAVDRHAVARPHAQPVADLHLLERHLLVVAAGVSRRAVLGARLSNARIAPPVCSRARSSSTWPSSTSTVMTAAASK